MQAHASRCSVVIDCAPYYKAVYEAIQKARQSVFIVGWDIDSRIELLRGDDKPDKDQSYTIADVLRRKAEDNPQIQIYLLKWASSFIYAKERESLPVLKWRFKTPSNVHFCMDGAILSGASQHQKIIVIDDQIAFSGGMDIALGRWDTREHLAENPLRSDPSGDYGPYRDIQMLVDGQAAEELAKLARWRWHRAAGYHPLKVENTGKDVWPDSVPVDFEDIQVNIVQTFPEMADTKEKREVESALMEHVSKAEHFIYIENQFLTYLPLARAINRQLHAKPDLKVMMVSSYGPQGTLEKEVMWQGRIAFRKIVEEGIDNDRIQMLYPVCLDKNGEDHDMHIHSKFMVVDDKILQVGSANLNGRSMGVDAECDLFVTGKTQEQKKRISEIRDTLIAEHSEVSNGRALRPIDDQRFEDKAIGQFTRKLGDPDRPFLPDEFDPGSYKSEEIPMWQKILYRSVWVILALIVFVGVWHLFRQPEVIDWIKNFVSNLLAGERKGIFGISFIIGTYVVLTSLSFPLTVLIGLTASVYGPVLGFVYALMGSMVSIIVQFFIGFLAGQKFLRKLMGTKLQKIDEKLEKADVHQVAFLRMLPIAPFGLINLAAGVSSVLFIPFILGSFLGLLPGTAALAILGDSLASVIMDLSLGNAVYFAFAVTLWIALIWGTQILVKYWRKKKEAKA